jgi:hypothetical protein
MLGNENRVLTHRRLPAVVLGLGRREPLFDKVSSVIKDHVEPFRLQVLSFFRSKLETAAKLRSAQAFEDVVQVIHRASQITDRFMVSLARTQS